VALAPGWVAQGAAYVGGCCRVGPDLIAELRAAVSGRP
jgi:homocysteine S-methyltransferase